MRAATICTVLALVFSTLPPRQTLAQQSYQLQDSRTKQPIAGVTGRLRGGHLTLSSNAQGRLTVPADTGQLQLSHLSYEPLQVALRRSSGPVLVELTPRTVELPGVSVRSSGNLVRLTPPGTLRKSAPSATPNWFASAIWHRAPSPGNTFYLQAVEVQLAKRPLCRPDEVVQDQQAFREGRVRVQLLMPAADGTFALADSLTSALLITPALSRQNKRGTVRLDISARHLVLPPTGVVVVLDVLPTHANEQMADDRPVPERDRVDVRRTLPDGRTEIRRTSECDYPALAEMQNSDPGQCISVIMLLRHAAATTRLSAVPKNRRSPNNLGVTLELKQL